MVIVLPSREKESFGAKVGANLGAGISAGIGSALQERSQERLEQQKMQQRQQLINDIRSKRNQGSQAEEFRTKIIQNMPQIKQELGFEPNAEQIDQIVSHMTNQGREQQTDPFSEAEEFAAIGEHDLSKVASDRAKAQIEENRELRKERTAKENKYFDTNEPKLMEIANTERNLATEEARLDRLQELFKSQGQFPSPLLVGLFTKEGALNDTIYSQLSPDAQEAVKLIVDSTSNIKDTYGARITNFDLQTYIKKLPSLLNSPEGNSRVIRDLKIINQLNQLHANGIMDIFEEHGGSNKLPYSTAERIYKKRFGEQEKALRKQFVEPSKKNFTSLPSASQYLGRKIRNPDTGEVMISDGKEWKPF